RVFIARGELAKAKALRTQREARVRYHSIRTNAGWFSLTFSSADCRTTTSLAKMPHDDGLHVRRANRQPCESWVARDRAVAARSCRCARCGAAAAGIKQG